MVQAIGDMDLALARDNLNAWADGDRRFHESLVELSGNKRLAELVHTMRDQTHRARMIVVRLRPNPVESNIEHRAAYEAIRRGDWRRGRNILRVHRMRGRDMILDILAQYRLPPL
jgi:DNA-binding GntR family transcriptional regulator